MSGPDAEAHRGKGRRPLTGPDLPTPRPVGSYAPAAVGVAGERLEVRFDGEDGRTRTFVFATLPLPGLHADLAAAAARRIGPTGGLRTRSAAGSVWVLVGRFVRFLAGLDHPPADLAELTAGHVRGYRWHRARTCNDHTVVGELRGLRLLLSQVMPPERLRPEVPAELAQRRPLGMRPTGRPGYSEGEFQRIMAAARQDAVAIRERLHAGERLLTHPRLQPGLQPGGAASSGQAAVLAEIARTGVVPRIDLAGSNLPDLHAMVALAAQLFMVDEDLAPLLVLGVGLTGRNGETIKELPAAHQVLENRVVAVELTKRRRGPGKAYQSVHWEIGGPSRQLHTPGGYYLLLCELSRRSRAFSGSASAWSVWVVRGGHVAPFATNIGHRVGLQRWARTRDLRDDHGDPLTLDLNRLKTTVEVRTTKAAGGHLPSSVRTNTMDVLFGHYLRGDPSVREWADEVVTAAISDAERDARRAHLRVLAGPVEQLHDDLAAVAERLNVSPQAARQLLAGELDTAVAACLDIEHSPFNEGLCRASFVSCLQCENALATHRHLPGLLALLDWLEGRRQAMDAAEWWRRHGQAWVALTEGILPKFTPAEVAQAQAAKPATLLLDLLEGPRQAP